MEKNLNLMSALQTANSPAYLELDGNRYLVVGLGPANPKNESNAAYPDRPAIPSDSDSPSLSAAIDSKPERGRYVYGLKGLAELFGCSKSTAFNIKKSGKIDAAISQIGSTIVVDVEKALELSKRQ